MQKVAVLRDPQTGFDAAQSYTPSATLSLVNAVTGAKALTAAAKAWNAGATHAQSGDKAWWFDFSSVTAPGRYYVLDEGKGLRSPEFDISDTVYDPVLRQAMRTFFYQRSGFAKEAPYAEAGWTDGASHLQDKTARRFLAKDDASTEVDVSGGWYDAGDLNKYTNWTADYIITMLRAYRERPEAWSDDFGIPESGNCVPDLLDEARFGLDHLIRLQRADGSMLSVVGAAGASPPSAATGPSYYGDPSTSATLAGAAAFALASVVFRAEKQTCLADDLLVRAKRAYEWAEANPNVQFRNNEGATNGLAAGQQEVNDYGRLSKKVRAAVYLFEATGTASYRTFVDANHASVHLVEWNFAYPFEPDEQTTLLDYTLVADATPATTAAIKAAYLGSMNTGGENFPAHEGAKDPYLAHMKDYTWGSNAVKSHQGSMFHQIVSHKLDATLNSRSIDAAGRYINYLHGVNPLQKVYLSNMGAYGAENSVSQFYHTWFTDGSAKWDEVGKSEFGPAPGFLVGGPNPSYGLDGCCPSSCGSAQNNALCAVDVTPPLGQPAQKSYADFNNNWPANSWSVTENSDGYQLAYIRLLSKFTSKRR